MERISTVPMVFLGSALLLLVLYGCNDSGSIASKDFDDVIAGWGPGREPEPPGSLGPVVDLGDLVYPNGDRWYYTRARAIGNSGTVVGLSPTRTGPPRRVRSCGDRPQVPSHF